MNLEKGCEDCKPLTKEELRELNRITDNQYTLFGKLFDNGGFEDI